MHTKQTLLCDLKSMGLDPKGILLVHSSMKAIGEVEGGADTVLDALCEYMKDGLLLLPTHTWGSVNKDNPFFDVKNSVGCVGILPELFRKREGVFRSCHPTHSVAGFGKNAKQFLEGEEHYNTPCNINSSWGKLYTMKGNILLLGVTMTSNTFIHGIEEWANIPNRISEASYDATIKTYDKTVITKMHPHQGSVSNNYNRVKDECIEKGIVKKVKIGSAESLLCDAYSLCEFLTEKLKNNTDLFSNI